MNPLEFLFGIWENVDRRHKKLTVSYGSIFIIGILVYWITPKVYAVILAVQEHVENDHKQDDRLDKIESLMEKHKTIEKMDDMAAAICPKKWGSKR